MRRIPVVATLIVLLAAAAMVRLGFWQLDRAREKAALMAQYRQAASLPPMAYPAMPTDMRLLFRRAAGLCLAPVSERVEAGRNLAGRAGWRHIIACRTGAEGPGMTVDIGWSAGFAVKSGWSGGEVSGIIAQQPDHGSLIARALGRSPPPQLMLVADKPGAGLKPSAPPQLADIPDNHRAYAVQWFVFAGLAILIYALAVRRRLGR